MSMNIRNLGPGFRPAPSSRKPSRMGDKSTAAEGNSFASVLDARGKLDTAEFASRASGEELRSAAALSAGEDASPERLDLLRSQIAEGRYQVAAESIAARIVPYGTAMEG